MTGRYSIGAWYGSGFFAAAVETWTRSVYYHAGLVTPDGTVLESQWPDGVRQRPLRPDENVVRFGVEGCSLDRWRLAEQFCREQIGKKFDLRGVFRFVTKVPHSQNGKWFCSELVFQAFLVAGIPLLERVGAEQVPPAGIVRSPLLYPQK